MKSSDKQQHANGWNNKVCGRDGEGCAKAEVQPGRRDRLEVFRAREEVEDEDGPPHGRPFRIPRYAGGVTTG